MKHMIYFIFLLLIIHNYTILCLRKEKLIENILYGHSITDFSQLPLKNNKQTIPLCTVEPTIKNFSAYISSFNSTKVNVYHNGKCSYDFKLKHYYNNENLANLESILNENNYSFRDYYGNLIIVDHGNGVETWYGHCSKLYAKVGDTVTAGDVVAAVGSTGNSTGPHLHLGIRLNNKYVNPVDYF